MKKLLITTMMLISIYLKAQIPNASFEQWSVKTMFGKEVVDPDGWHSSNVGLALRNYPPSVVPTSDAYAGEKAMKLFNVQNDFNAMGYCTSLKWLNQFDFIDKFPVQGKPTRLSGFYKYLYTTKDTFSVVVMMYKDGYNIGYGALYKDSLVSTYSPFNVDIEYFVNDTIMPDSASISITCSEIKEEEPNLSVELFIDELSFEGIVNSINDHFSYPSLAVSVFPNPSDDYITIKFDQKSTGFSEVKIFDILGNEMAVVHKNMQTPTGLVELKWDISGFKPGMYFVQVKSNSNLNTTRINTFK